MARLGGSMQKNKGFTLIELMVTIAVMAIIAMMAAPSFIKLVRNYQLTTDTRDFIDLLAETRSEAIFKQKPQILAVNTTVADSYKTWVPSHIQKDSGDTSITFKRLGQTDNAECFIFSHKSDSTLKAYVYVQKGGTVVYNKSLTSCPT